MRLNKTFAAVLSLGIFSRNAYAAEGCEVDSVTGVGFNVKYYDYPYASRVGYDDPNFFIDGYTQYGQVGFTSGVTDVAFDSAVSTKGEIGLIYGVDTTVSNFVLELTGYFYAATSGTYTFNLTSDDGVSLQVGAGTKCCGKVDDSVTGDFSVLSVGHDNNGKQYVLGVNTAQVTLTAGLYYPVKLIYFQIRQAYVMELVVEQPDGSVIDNFDNVYQVQLQEPQCPASSSMILSLTSTEVLLTLTSTGSSTTEFTTTFTVTPLNGLPYTSTEVVTVTTEPELLTLTSTGSSTTEFTTTFTVTPLNGSPYTSTEVVTVTTEPELLTLASTESSTTELTTTLTVTPPNGSPYTSTEVVTVTVDLPLLTLTSIESSTTELTTTFTVTPASGTPYPSTEVTTVKTVPPLSSGQFGNLSSATIPTGQTSKIFTKTTVDSTTCDDCGSEPTAPAPGTDVVTSVGTTLITIPCDECTKTAPESTPSHGAENGSGNEENGSGHGSGTGSASPAFLTTTQAVSGSSSTGVVATVSTVAEGKAAQKLASLISIGAAMLCFVA